MSYSLPTFNLTANIWRNGNPTSNPPDVVSPCNLALGRRQVVSVQQVLSQPNANGEMYLLLPAGTDIRDLNSTGANDTVEVGAGSGRFYVVAWVDDAGAGFPNEHRVALLWREAAWPVPFPRPAGGPVPPPVSSVFSQTGVGSAPAIATLPGIAGLAVMSVVCGNSVAPASPVVTSTSLGVLAPINGWRVVTGPASVGKIAHFAWLVTAAGDTIIVPSEVAGQTSFNGCVFSGTGEDQTGTSGAFGTSLLGASCGGPNSNVSEYALLSYLYFASSQGDSVPDPWGNPGFTLSSLAFGGWGPIWWGTWLAKIPGTGPASGTIAISPGPALAIGACIDSFLP
jgi:hypothetical protein